MTRKRHEHGNHEPSLITSLHISSLRDSADDDGLFPFESRRIGPQRFTNRLPFISGTRNTRCMPRFVTVSMRIFLILLRVFLRLCDDSGKGRRRCWSQTIPQHLRERKRLGYEQ